MNYAISWREANKVKKETLLQSLVPFIITIGLAIIAHALFIILIP
jgi:hypothetical protein